MKSSFDVAAVRLDNAMRLFDEFVTATVRQPDAATLRGLERRFAERLQIQPSYWSQIKGRSRQIGERLARQFEINCGKPAGWMDVPHGTQSASANPVASRAESPAELPPTEAMPHQPRDEDERFIIGLVLTYYRRHPQRARTRLLDLLGEVLVPQEVPAAAAGQAPQIANKSPNAKGSSMSSRTNALPTAKPSAPAPADDPAALWRSTQTGVAPLRPKR